MPDLHQPRITLAPGQSAPLQLLTNFFLQVLRDGEILYELREFLRQPVCHLRGLQAAREDPYSAFLDKYFLRLSFRRLELLTRE